MNFVVSFVEHPHSMISTQSEISVELLIEHEIILPDNYRMDVELPGVGQVWGRQLVRGGD